MRSLFGNDLQNVNLKGFEECTYFSWVKDSSSADYQTCTVKSTRSTLISSSNTDSGMSFFFFSFLSSSFLIFFL